MFNSLSDKRQQQIGVVFLVLLVLLSIFFLAKTMNEFERRGASGHLPTITVSGEGEVVAIPDVATFSFSVQEERDTTAAAQESVTEQMNTILDLLKDEGIEEKDIKTTNYSIFPQYDFIQCISAPCPPSRRELRGYEVSHTIEVKIRDTEEVGDVLALVGDAGADNVSGINFSIDDEEALREEARAKAIEDARAKAKQLAEDLDVRIKGVVSFNESGDESIYYARQESLAMDGMGGGPSASPSIPSGENTILSRVHITYEIR